MGISFLNSNSAKEVVSVSVSPNEDIHNNEGIESWKGFAIASHQKKTEKYLEYAK